MSSEDRELVRSYEKKIGHSIPDDLMEAWSVHDGDRGLVFPAVLVEGAPDLLRGTIWLSSRQCVRSQVSRGRYLHIGSNRSSHEVMLECRTGRVWVDDFKGGGKTPLGPSFGGLLHALADALESDRLWIDDDGVPHSGKPIPQPLPIDRDVLAERLLNMLVAEGLVEMEPERPIGGLVEDLADCLAVDSDIQAKAVSTTLWNAPKIAEIFGDEDALAPVIRRLDG